ncbi:TPA: hypothetical protein ACPFI9_000582 [Providencia rettgeri]
MKNNTSTFIELITNTKNKNENYFFILEKLKIESYINLKNKIFEDFHLSHNAPYEKLIDSFKKSIAKYISDSEILPDMDVKVLNSIANQIEIEYLHRKMEKKEAQFYYFFSKALTYYGIYVNTRIISLEHTVFWEGLIKMLFVLKLLDDNNYYSNSFNEDYRSLGFDTLPKLVEAAEVIKNKLNEDIDIVDGLVRFKINQEDKIISKIENKLSKLNLFNTMEFIFRIYEDDKSKNKIESTIPYKYLINIMVKNIFKSNHKNIKKNKSIYALELLISFMSLYQLKEDKFFINSISGENVTSHLRKQVLYSNFYPLYSLKTDTLIEYINNIIRPSIDEKIFSSYFEFGFNDLIQFFLNLDKQDSNIIILSKESISKEHGKILDLFSIDKDLVNEGYGTIKSLSKNTNIFSLNPIIKNKGKYYIFGFKYFKMNFYNSLLEKIRKKIDKSINNKIGLKIDNLVENVFNRISSKHGYELFSGNYTPPKKENPESDLLIKTDDDLILIENKNKYLTHASFSGSEVDILKDFVLSFVFSQKQLFKHERNIRKYKKLNFASTKQEFEYNNQNIIKISVSTNNWFNIMNNPSSYILSSLENLRFNIDSTKKNTDDFKKANKNLIEIFEVINELYGNKDIKMNEILTQTVFLPLELIIDKYKDDDFIEIIKKLPQVKMNTNNILDTYDYLKYMKLNPSSNPK